MKKSHYFPVKIYSILVLFKKKFYICLKLPSLASTAAQPSSMTQGHKMDLTQIERTVTQIKRVNHISIPKNKREENSGQLMDLTQIERTYCNVT